MAWTVTTRPQSTVEIRGEVTAEEFAAFRDIALAKLKKTISLPGFRPGHIPEGMLQNQLGEGAILEEMARFAIAKIYPALLQEHQLDALGSPQITITKIAKDSPLGLIIKTAVLPKIELGDYHKRLKAIAEKKVELPAKATEEEKIKAKNHNRLELLEELLRTTPFELPEILVESEIERLLGEMKARLIHQGIKYHDYLKHLKQTEAELRQSWRSETEKRIRTHLLFDTILTQERLTNTEEVWQNLEKT